MPPGGNAGWEQGRQLPVEHLHPSVRPTNGFAITALVTSLVLAPLGIIFGHLALRQISRSGESGRGLAIGGLVIGYLWTLAAVIAVIVFVVPFGEAARSNEETSAYTPTQTYSDPAPAEVKIFVTNSGPATSSEEQSQMDAASAGMGTCISVSGGYASIDRRDSCDGTWVVVDRFVTDYSAGEDPFTQADAEAKCPGSYAGFHLSINCLELKSR